MCHARGSPNHYFGLTRNPVIEIPKPLSTDSCPCGSGEIFGGCCAPILNGELSAPNAERLMRSRFTAHAVHDFPYLHRTFAETRDTPYVEDEYGNDIEWTKLVVHAHETDIRPGVSRVDFSAYFSEEGRDGVLHEKSEFERSDGEWIFTKTLREGPAPVKAAPKIGRNDACPCGSGKKFKKCCGR